MDVKEGGMDVKEGGEGVACYPPAIKEYDLLLLLE
jgi:hypothetical protein